MTVCTCISLYIYTGMCVRICNYLWWLLVATDIPKRVLGPRYHTHIALGYLDPESFLGESIGLRKIGVSNKGGR